MNSRLWNGHTAVKLGHVSGPTVGRGSVGLLGVSVSETMLNRFIHHKPRDICIPRFRVSAVLNARSGTKKQRAMSTEFTTGELHHLTILATANSVVVPDSPARDCFLLFKQLNMFLRRCRILQTPSAHLETAHSPPPCPGDRTFVNTLVRRYLKPKNAHNNNLWATTGEYFLFILWSQSRRCFRCEIQQEILLSAPTVRRTRFQYTPGAVGCRLRQSITAPKSPDPGDSHDPHCLSLSPQLLITPS